ncbi:MAG: NADH-quinone oxidoreductase subunit A [Nitrososphaerota archaeon]
MEELIIALTVTFLVILLIYLLGGRLSVKAPKSRMKLEPYACGESLPPARSPIRLLFFNFAALFLVFDVIALFLAFTINIPPAYKPGVISLLMLYVLVLGIAIQLLGRRR